MRKLISLFCFLLLSNVIFAQNIISLNVDILYDSVSSLDGRYFAVKSNGKWGVVKDNKLILPCEYDYIDALGDDVISFVNGDRVGFADVNGKILFPETYPAVVESDSEEKTQFNLYDKGSCIVSDNGRLKLIDKNNKSLLGDSLTIVSRVGDAVVIKQNGLYGMVNSKGVLTVPPKYLSLETLVPGKLYSYQVHNDYGMPGFGLLDGNGELRTSPIYDDFRTFKTAESIFVKAYDSMGKQALFSTEGEIVMQSLYQIAEPSKFKGLYNIGENLKKGVIGADYVVRVFPKYDDVRIVEKQDTFYIASLGLESFVLKGKNKTIFKTDGLILDIIPLNQDSIAFVVEQDLSYGLCTQDGKWLIEPIYDEVIGFVGENLCVRKANKWGAVDLNGNVVVDFKYEKAKVSSNGKIVAFYDYKKGSKLLNEESQIIDFPSSDNLLVYGDYVEYKVGKKKERLYSDGRKIPAMFLAIGTESGGVLCAKTNKGWSYFDSKTFSALTEKTFDAAACFVNGIAFVAKDGKILVLGSDYSVKQSLEMPNGVNLSLAVSALTIFRSAGKKSCSVVNNKTNKTGVISIE
ncbi:MAG: WG repeat-containing protein [Bacteroidales bacterium]|nr:WG repeat-containing protein [Bacteroidales bacterium]